MLTKVHTASGRGHHGQGSDEGFRHQHRRQGQEAAGNLTGDSKLKGEGKMDQAKGKVQNAIGGIKDAIKGKS